MSRQGILTTVTMLVLSVVLVLGVMWGWQALFAEVPDQEPVAEPPAESCTTQRVDAGERIRSRQVEVSVFNAGTRSGLAGDTMGQLRDRGFRAGQVGNAPADVEVNKVQVWTTLPNDAEARLVARQFGKKVKVRVSEVDLGPGVDVVVGDRFRELAKAKRTLKVKEPQEICVPVDDPTPADTTAS